MPAGTGVPAIVTPFDVLTYHDDAERTGLNNVESVLTPSRVASDAFSKLNTVSFSGHPDAQPLVVSAQTWEALGYGAQYPHDVVYVATESNDLFAIDGVTGKILLQRNFGTPVAQANLPADCRNNPATVGINSTPVIDLASKAIYLISYGQESNGSTFRVHKINLVDLSDNLPSVVVAGTGRLSDGSTINFAAAYQRQRPGLLLANGNLYAGFGSFCDQASNYSRGWVLGWNASNLSALPAALMEQQTTAQIGGGLQTTDVGIVDFLSSIWQSGYGLAADSSGYIYAQTGNSSGHIANNYPDSVVKLPAKLGTVSDSFTPSNFAALDAADEERGSAGVMVVPDQPNGLHFAVAPGKDGRMFLLNRDALGGYVANGHDVPPHVTTAGCWCGPDYYVGSDDQARVVLSSGIQVQTWTLPATATGNLTADASAVQIPAGSSGDPGFMSAVSSYGSLADSAVIWGVSRAINGRVYLQAVDGTSGAGGGSPALNGINTSVTDKAGRVWSFGTSTRNPGEHSLLINGAATTGWGVKLVIGNDGLAYNLNSAGQWYTGDGTHWTQQQAPPAARMPSQAGTAITPASGTAITDSAGNVWAFGPNARNPGEYNLVRNGVPTSSYAVKLVIGSDGNLNRYNYYRVWYAANGTTWTQLSAAPPTYLPSRVGATIYPAYGGSLTDAAGNVWSYGSTKRNPGEYNVVRNGVATSNFAVKLVIGSDRNLYRYTYQGVWYAANGTNWTQLSAAPNTFAPVYGSYLTPAAAGELRELQLVDSGAWVAGHSNANIVPVVANGRVYVASTNTLTIWGVE
ncbi:MAG: hypothetical protein JOZ12_03945 [Sinobacteraceae bacterium]|nr:hypothetical protein [Nevskiaceae bacterium]